MICCDVVAPLIAHLFALFAILCRYTAIFCCILVTGIYWYGVRKQVRTWERTLNRVNETLDMWYTVQRKWMYLESIFVGAEDIRLQLPEEAKKFDAIDKAFKQASTTYNNTPVLTKLRTVMKPRATIDT